MSKRSELILVTGGAGYVGSTFIRDALAEGYGVRCLDLLIYGGGAILGFMNHPNFEFVKGDIRDQKVVTESLKDVDHVIHLAAIVGDKPCQASPLSAQQINYEGTQLLAEQAKEAGVKRFLFASTCSNYGVSDPTQPATESTRLNPVSLYAETKIDCERFLQDVGTDEFAVTSLRFATAFGISFRTRFDLLINSFAYEAWTSKEIVVFAANTWRPYIHVADMSRILSKFLAAPVKKVASKVYNAGATAQNYLKKDLVQILKTIMPQLKTKYLDTIDDRRDYRVSFEKLESEIGFEPTRLVKDGFRELLNGFESEILTKRDFETNNLEALEHFFENNLKLTQR